MTIADALADTSMFIAIEQGRPLRLAPPSSVAVSCVTIAELLLGVLTAGTPEQRRLRVATLRDAQRAEPLLVDGAVAEAWARLTDETREQKRSRDSNDSWIAATAIAHGIPVVTQDAGFARVPGLEVIRV